jgi:enoyl-CoA hydratase/carnithine racemase
MVGLTRLPQPVIAQVHGVAAAAGCQLVATRSRSRIASALATSGEIRYFLHTRCSLARDIGRKRAPEMLLTGEFTDPNGAAHGPVNRVVALGTS